MIVRQPGIVLVALLLLTACASTRPTSTPAASPFIATNLSPTAVGTLTPEGPSPTPLFSDLLTPRATPSAVPSLTTAPSSPTMGVAAVVTSPPANPSGTSLAGSPSPAGTPTTSTTAAAATSPTAATAGNAVWPVFDVDAARSGTSAQEQAIDRTTVKQLAVRWVQHLPGVVDSSPVEQAGRLYLNLRDGGTLALNAQTGAQLWLAPSAGQKITQSSPALDPSGTWVYSYGLDGFVQKYETATGHEVTGGRWPVQTTLMPDVEKGGATLNLANGRLFVANGGYVGDRGHYEGHLTAIDLASGAATVFNTLCSNLTTLLTSQVGKPNYCASVQSGVWARAGTVVDPTNGNVFIATGNGPWDGKNDWGDSVLELSPDLRTLIDSYAPTNQDKLNQSDVDLGSTMPALIPEQKGSKTPFMAVQVGKDGLVRLLNRRDLSGQGKIGQLGGELQTTTAPGNGQVLSQPAVWVDPDGVTWIFVSNASGLEALRLMTDPAGQSKLVRFWEQSVGGTSPIVVNGVLYLARNQTLEARDPTTGDRLWASPSVGQPGAIGAIHWESPIVVNGQVILADESGNLTAFGLPRG